MAEQPGATTASNIVGVLWRDERIRYLATGGMGAAIFYGVYAAGWYLSGGTISYLVLLLMANLAVVAFTFRFYRNGVFRSDVAVLPGFARFYLVCLSSLVGSLTLVPLMVEVMGVPAQIAPIIYLAVQPFIFYPINKFWVFRHRRAAVQVGGED